jgi:ubiquinone/menaquinone biosynthesis C-methylase UbiE
MHDRMFPASEAHRLEDPERLIFMPARDVVAAMELAPGMTVADIGAGTGYFALPMALAVQPGGRVFAVDTQPEMLRLLDIKLGAPLAPDNITLVEGKASATSLDDSTCDRVLAANIWHELKDHAAVLAEFARILKPGGSVAILDWRSDVPARSAASPRSDGDPPGPPMEHRISAETVQQTLRDQRWSVLKTANSGLYSYLILARPQ